MCIIPKQLPRIAVSPVTVCGRVFSGLIFFVLYACVSSAHAQRVVPDFYKEAGLYPTRDYVNQHIEEHIDPFTGSLQIHSTDVFVPGQGGMDIRVQRSYNSNNINPANPAAGETQSHVGLGWNIHFGRVLRLGSNPLCGLNSADGRDDPVLELPDGSRQKLYFTQSVPNLLSTRMWRADCMPGGSGSMRVFTPEGVRYDMTLLATVLAGAPTIRAWYATRITDANGNWISINYTPTATIPRIAFLSTNDGRRVDFTYNATTGLVEYIVGPAGQWRYEYVTLGSSGRQALWRVTRPDGTVWTYNHNAFVAPGSADNYQLRSVTYPQGGTIVYNYGWQNFNPAAANPAHRTVVVVQKDANNGVGQTGRWTFVYRPGASAGVEDVTEVSTPAGPIVYRHFGATTATNGFVWKIGVLLSKQIGSEQKETYEWERGNLISTTANLRDGFFGVRDTQTFSARLAAKTVERRGTTYITRFSSYDAYDNPLAVTETGPNGGERRTDYVFDVRRSFGTGDADRWILRLPTRESLVHQSLQAGLIARDFDGNGNIKSVTLDGVRTTYEQFSPPTGDVWRVTKPRGLVSIFTNYWRGIPQNEVHAQGYPEQISITRTVSSAGNVETETDGENRLRKYQYDGLNRLRVITPPPNPSNPLAATYIDYTSNSKTARRGSAPQLVQTTTYDGFGRVASVTLGGVTTSYVHDVLGRLVFVSFPGDSKVGTSYEYDQLGRLRFARHPDKSFVERSFPTGDKMSVTDERGFVTTYVYRGYGDPDQQYVMEIRAPAGVASAGVVVNRNARGLVTMITQDGAYRTFGYDTRYYLVCASLPEILADGVTVPDCASNPLSNVVRYGRDDAGNMTSRTVGASGSTGFLYDQLNRLAQINYPSLNTPSVTQTYTKTNKLSKVSSATGERKLDYDANDNVEKETISVDGRQLVAVYRYNDKEQLRAVQYPVSNREITYQLDALGRVKVIDGVLTDVQYWPSGQVKLIAYANGVRTEYAQDARLRPSSLKVQRASSAAEIDQTWLYDTAGNLKTIADTADATFNRTFTYDPLNRVEEANAPGLWGAGKFGYDGRGNIRSQTFGTSALTYVYGTTNNRLTRIDGSSPVSYSYDAYGNVSNRSGATFAFDDASNLRCFNCAFSNRIAYGYDGRNQRLWVERGSVRSYEFWTFGGSLLAEYTPARYNQLTEFIYLTDKRIAQRTIDSRTATATALTVSPSAVTTDQAVTLRATVTGGSPTGNVSFRAGGAEIAVRPLSAGVATASIGFATAGTRRISAYYLGNNSSAPSGSAPADVVVSPSQVATTTTVSTSAAPPIDVRACVPIVATISGSAPTGTATMTWPGQVSPRSVSLVAGRATFPGVRLRAGSVPITVTYSGDARNRSSSGQLTLSIAALPAGWTGSIAPCSAWSITQPAPVNVTRQGAGVVSGSALISTTGGVAPFTYVWNRATGSTAISVAGAQTATFSANLATGASASAVYTATVTDATGDSGTISLNVTLAASSTPPPAALSVSISPSLLTGSRRGPGPVTGSATASTTGGTPPISYSWTQLNGSVFSVTGASNATLTLTGTAYAAWCDTPQGAEGVFRVTVRDAAGVTASRDLQVIFSATPAGPPPADCATLLRATRQQNN